MNNSSRNSHSYQETLEMLTSVRLSAHQLAEARIQLARAEAFADLVYGAWTVLGSVTRRATAAIVRAFAALADTYAQSASKASMRQRDRYLTQATDTADLERRLRSWQTPRYALHLN